MLTRVLAMHWHITPSVSTLWRSTPARAALAHATSNRQARHVGVFRCTILFVAATLAGCEWDPFEATPPDQRATTRVDASTVPGPPEWTIDARFVNLTRQVPGFAGFFFENDVPVVQLVDHTQRERARAALTGAFASLATRGPELEFRQARYDFVQLNDWMSRLSDVLDTPGLVFTDIDEVRNRITVGLQNALAGRSSVEDLLRQLDVPFDAVIVEEAQPIRFTQTLRDRIRPVRGALEITTSDTPATLGCTLGFNAVPADLPSSRMFVTASHCSLVQGAVDGTQVWQKTKISSNFIGEEFRDPGLFTCFPGKACRYSDATLVQYDAAASWDFQFIARTKFRGQSTGSIIIDSQKPRFKITAARRTNPIVGMSVNKIGWKTGWTYGPVINTCQNVTIGSIMMLCQDRVSAGQGPGDSGSPVFFWPPGSDIDITLFGVLWGGNVVVEGEFGDEFLYSNLGNVDHELGWFSPEPGTGSLRVFPTGGSPPPPPPPPPGCEPPQPECS